MAGAHKGIKAIMDCHVISKLSKTKPSGRALVYVAPFNVGASLCINKNGKIATIAICKPSVRGAAQPGDVIIVISPALGTPRTTLIFQRINMFKVGQRMRGPTCANDTMLKTFAHARNDFCFFFF